MPQASETIWVKVREDMPPGHIRTPQYLRGKLGIIERKLGPFGNPEQLAYRLKADLLPLLRVRFTMKEIWGDLTEYPNDTLEAEIYAHWLEEIKD